MQFRAFFLNKTTTVKRDFTIKFEILLTLSLSLSHPKFFSLTKYPKNKLNFIQNKIHVIKKTSLSKSVLKKFLLI